MKVEMRIVLTSKEGDGGGTTMCKAVETDLVPILGAKYWDPAWKDAEELREVEVDLGSDTYILWFGIVEFVSDAFYSQAVTSYQEAHGWTPAGRDQSVG